MSRCRRYLVRGQVQGVFFRASTRDVARRLGLAGWVRNRRDGTVELVACGADRPLAELEGWLRRGPPAARVDAVESEPADDPGSSDFEVRS